MEVAHEDFQIFEKVFPKYLKRRITKSLYVEEHQVRLNEQKDSYIGRQIVTKYNCSVFVLITILPIQIVINVILVIVIVRSSRQSSTRFFHYGILSYVDVDVNKPRHLEFHSFVGCTVSLVSLSVIPDKHFRHQSECAD